MTQLIAGVRPAWLFTVPVPVPDPAEILIVKGPLRNCAETVRATVMVTLQVPVPLQAFPQAANECPDAGVAVNLTTRPLSKSAEHPAVANTPAVILQLIPSGTDFTTPFPVPRPVMLSRYRTVANAADGGSTSVVSRQACRITMAREDARRKAAPVAGRIVRSISPRVGDMRGWTGLAAASLGRSIYSAWNF